MDPTLGRLIGCQWESYNDADWLSVENIENEMMAGCIHLAKEQVQDFGYYLDR